MQKAVNWIIIQTNLDKQPQRYEPVENVILKIVGTEKIINAKTISREMRS